MAGTITNIINTIFRTEGADRTERDTNRVGRSQTRLGQASASAGREFSSQASGLGGLVAAYAGAAATTFALSAAFDALARSARAAQTLEGLNSIAAASAESGESILQSVRDITNAQLTITEAAQQINLSLSAGFDSSQIDGLSEVALKASRALGRDLTDAFTRVVRGSAKLETELLDELGIYTKIDPATRSYAAAIGKTASELTEYERRQAFVNSVIEEGQRKYASINTTIPTTAEKIEAFGTKISDLTTKVGVFIAEALAPLAQFLTENIGASIGALGLAGALALGKTVEVLRGSLERFEKSIEERAARASALFQRFNKEAVAAGQTAVRGISLSPVGLAGGLREELKALRDVSQQRALSNTELRRANSLLQQRQANLSDNRTALLQQRDAQLAVRNAAASTNAQIAEANKKIKQLNASLRRVAVASVQTTAQMNALGAATAKTAGLFGTLAAAGTAGILRLGSAIATVALGALSLGGFLVGAISLFGLLGSAIANAAGKGDEFNAFVEGVGDFFSGLLTNAERAEKKGIFLGATANALEEIEAVDSGLRELDEFQFKKKKALGIEFNVTKTKQELVNEVSSILADVANESQKTIGESIASGSTAGFAAAGAIGAALLGAKLGAVGGPLGIALGAIVGGALGTAFEYFSSDEISIDSATRNRLTAEFADSLNAATPDVQEKLIQALARVEEKYAGAAAADPVAAAALKLQKQLIASSAEVLENVNAIADVVAATGQSAQLISKNYDFESVGDGLLSAYKDAITEIEGVTIRFRSFDIDDAEVQRVINEEIPTLAFDIPTTFEDIASLQQDQERINSLPPVLKDLVVNFDASKDSLVSFIDAIETIPQVATLAEPFTAFSTALNAVTQESIRAVEVLRSTADGVNNLSISYEQFQQSVGNAEKALDRSNNGLVKAANELQALRDERAGLSAEELPEQDALIAAEEKRFAALIDTVESAKELLSILKEQEESFKRQADIQQFLKDIGTKSKNVFTLDFEIATESGQSPLEALSSLFKGSELAENAAEYNQFADDARSVLESIGVGSDTVAAVLRTNADNIETQARLISNAENITATVKGDFLVIKNTIKDTNGDLTDTTTRVGAVKARSQEIVENGILYNGVVEELKNRLDDVIKRTAILLINQDKATKQIKDQVNIKAQEVEIEAAKLRLQSKLFDIDKRIQANDAGIKAAKAAIETQESELELAELRLELAEEQSDIAISSLEAQLDLLDRIAEAELDRIETAKQTANILARSAAVSQLSQSSDPSERAALSIQLQAKAAEQQLNFELQAIAARTAQAQQEAIVRQQIATEEKSVADANLRAAQAELKTLEASKQDKLDIIRLESANAAETLKKQRAQALSELALAVRQENLKKDQLDAQIDADKAKATQQAQLLARELDIIQEDANLKNQYLTKLSQLTGIQISGDDEINTETVGEIRSRVTDFITEVNSLYDNLGTKQRGNIEEQARLDREAALAKVRATTNAIAAERSAGEQRVIDAEQQLDLEIQIARERVRGAEQAQALASDAITQATQSLAEARQSGLDEAAIAVAENVVSQLEQIEQFIDTLNKETISINLEADKLEQQIQDIANQEILLKARFEFDLSEIERSAALAAQQRVLDSLDLEKQLTQARESSGAISPVESATQINELESNIIAERRALLELEIQQEAERLEEQKSLIELQTQRQVEDIAARGELQASDIKARIDLLKSQGQAYKALLTGLQQTNQANIDSMSELYNSFGNNIATVFRSFASALGSAANAIASAVPGAEGIKLNTSGIAFEQINKPVLDAVEILAGRVIETPGGPERVDGALDSAINELDRAGQRLLDNNEDLITAQTTAAIEAADREGQLLEARSQARTDQLKSELKDLDTISKIEEEQAKTRLKQAKEAGGGAKDTIEETEGRLKDLASSFKSAFSGAFNSVIDYLINGGEEGESFGDRLKNAFGKLLSDIATKLLDTTIVEPISNSLSNILTSTISKIAPVDIQGVPLTEPVGGEIAKTAADAAGGALAGVPEQAVSGLGTSVQAAGQTVVSQINSTAQQLSGAVKQLGTNTQVGSQGAIAQINTSGMQLQQSENQLGLKIQTGANTASPQIIASGVQQSTAQTVAGQAVATSGAAASSGIMSAISAIWPILLVMGITSLLTNRSSSRSTTQMAIGGSVKKLAAGGMLRDRVPALLEPGEFVLRRAAANQIGEPALQRMNATGQAPSAAPIINIVNEGTPQEAQAEQPRFDGERYVIDIVTRDLQNNGPIRRSLRGGI